MLAANPGGTGDVHRDAVIDTVAKAAAAVKYQMLLSTGKNAENEKRSEYLICDTPTVSGKRFKTLQVWGEKLG